MGNPISSFGPKAKGVKEMGVETGLEFQHPDARVTEVKAFEQSGMQLIIDQAQQACRLYTECGGCR
jgi:hypothetical protein